LVTIFSLALLVVVLAGAVYALKKSGRFAKGNRLTDAGFPFTKRSDLLDLPSAALYDVLDSLLDRRYRVLSKVCLTRLLAVAEDLPAARQKAAVLALCGLAVDAVVCDRKTFSILGAVQIDPETDPDDGRRRSDAFVERALAAAGIPLVRVAAETAGDAEALKTVISRSMYLKWRPSDGVEPVAPAAAVDDRPTATGVESASARCPDCGARLIRRRAEKGRFAGKYFLACANYPRCKTLRLLKDLPPLAPSDA
jgi:hypothetical protein